MGLKNVKKLVAETGKMLLDQGLVARTWGNVSCRVDQNTFAITPSGLDYVGMRADDIAVVDIPTMKWKGKRKPSGEKGVHKVSYEVYDDVKFVIHTHQTYATAIGLAGFQNLDITEEESAKLGGIALAEYGLPGTKTLTQNVFKALLSGAKVVLMAHHGALICGSDREETFQKAVLLENICKRNTYCSSEKKSSEQTDDKAETLEEQIRKVYPHSKVISSAALLQAAEDGTVKAQVDDMAQMIGGKLIAVNEDKVLNSLRKKNALLIKGIGAVVKADNDEDMNAMAILVEKAAICSEHVKAYGIEKKQAETIQKKAALSTIDTSLMRLVYRTKYAKQKKG